MRFELRQGDITNQPDIDAIVCDTPDHRHARVCLDALHAVCGDPEVMRYRACGVQTYGQVAEWKALFAWHSRHAG